MMVLLLCIVFFLMLLLAGILVGVMLPGVNSILKIIIAIAFAFSVSSILFVLSVFLQIDFTVFLVCWCIMLMVLIWMNAPFIRAGIIQKNTGMQVVKAPVLLAGFGILIITILFTGVSVRWGRWDAWAIWNMHAKFLTYPQHFDNLFTGKISWTAADYPLMLSGFIAMWWRAIGNAEPITPSVVAYITALAVPLTVFAGLIKNKKLTLPFLILLLFAFDDDYMRQAASQYADNLLSLFYLLPFVLLHQTAKPDKEKYVFILIGFFTAASAWIKNEGILFFLVFLVFFIIQNRNSVNRIKYFFAGTFWPVSMLLFFKCMYAPANDIIGAQSWHAFQQLANADRYILTLKYFASRLYNQKFLAVLLLLLTVLLNRTYFSGFAFWVLGMVLLGYFFIYILTPHPLEWQLYTSCSRVLTQIFPAVIYTMAYGLNERSLRKELS
jgi:hypothetical protein